ncbi:hypothetical protein Y919_09085 [Caloranaerobacter azorensis H53214]|uniref:Cobalt ABC transporter permease n=1 Tax=Caloranaerobacter azorensis H53214 TaxID=1156417 RepID=A0A096DKU9_9FIRM|nr:cobalt ECF transporter T component CbiQ [Caloranaerobacter azorensis]KGG79916.1 hypothetical protein Y919_09085 [Caloranaerobacter azorensis H53214]
MILIDKYSYMNNIRKIHPMEKVLFGLFPLFTCIISKSLFLYIFVIITFSFSILAIAKIPIKYYLKILFIPLPFLIISFLAIAIDFSRTYEVLDYFIKIKSLYIGFKKEGLNTGIHLFFRVFASINCLYFISLTTPMNDVIWVLRRMKLPKIFVEIFMIIYRFIFVLLDTAGDIKNSQLCRLGYSSIKRGYYSLGKLISNVFIKSFHIYRMLFLSMISRGYDGEINVLEEEYEYSFKNKILISIYFAFTIVIAFF